MHGSGHIAKGWIFTLLPAPTSRVLREMPKPLKRIGLSALNTEVRAERHPAAAKSREP